MNELACIIRERRKSRGLTQAKLAELAGVSLSVVKSIESGNPKVAFENVNKVLNIFGHKLIAKEDNS
jgi:y4mF family transcriptional regulator